MISRRNRETAILWTSLPLCMGAGPSMLYLLSAVSPLVVADLGLSEAEYGSVATVAFISAAAASCSAGWAGRFDVRVVMVGVGAGAALGLLAFAVAHGYLILLVAAVFCGVAQAFSNSATNRVAAHVPTERRGTLIGWKQSGVPMAQLFVGLVGPPIAVAVGWRWATTAGALLAVLAVLTAAALRVPRQAVRAASVSPATRSASVARLTIFTFFMAFGLMSTNTYLPLFANRTLGMSAAVAGSTVAVIGAVGVASRVISARKSGRTGLHRFTLSGLACSAACGVVLIVSSAIVDPILMWIGAVIFAIAALSSNAVTMVALVHSISVEQIARTTGFVVAGMYLGFALGPLAFGAALHLSPSFEIAWSLPIIAFLLTALTGLPSIRVVT